MRKCACLIVCLWLLVCVPASADDFRLQPPIPGAMLRAFEDVGRYEAGHRGVDLAARPGEDVVASAQGVVFFAGTVAGSATISIDHGNGWRTTYQPVKALVAVGDVVSSGQRIGTVTSGHCATWCLHWGLTNGTDYADPMGYTETGQIRLLPHGAQPRVVVSIPAASVPAAPAAGLPADGRISSPFGMRVHPITGMLKMHDGTDIAAPCGTPIYTPLDGVVTRAYYGGGYGYRVFVDHGNGIVTSYNHLPGIEISVGTRVASGQRIGSVGTTGTSTGCHLHWMTWRDGKLVDPLSVFGTG